MLTAQKVWNQCCCWLSYLISLFGCLKIFHKPIFIAIEPADWCMLGCPECPVGMGKGKDKEHLHHQFSLRQLQILLDDIGDYLHTIIFHFQGEPLLNKQLPELIQLAKQRNIYTMLSTNAQLLNNEWAERLVRSGLDKIIVSMDGISQTSYEKYRVGGNVQKVKEALKFLSKYKTTFHSPLEIELQMLRLRSNETEWKEVKKGYKKWGATVLSMKTAQFYDYENGNPLMPTKEKYARYKKDIMGKWHLKKSIRNRCLRSWSGCVVDAEGNVLPCCFDKKRRYCFGNINEQSLSEIWKSEQMDEFRKTILSNRSKFSMCTNCTE